MLDNLNLRTGSISEVYLHLSVNVTTRELFLYPRTTALAI